MMAMDQQQQQRMQMHPSMYGRMPHSGMMPSQPQGHPGMPGSMGVPSAAGGVPGGPGADPRGPGVDPRQAMGMGQGGYHMSQHPSMMNNSQNNSYPGGVVPGGPPGGPVGPQGAQLPMTPHHQPYPHSQQQQQQPTQQQTQQQQHHNVPAASSSAPTHPSGNTSVSGQFFC